MVKSQFNKSEHLTETKALPIPNEVYDDYQKVQAENAKLQSKVRELEMKFILLRYDVDTTLKLLPDQDVSGHVYWMLFQELINNRTPEYLKP